MVQAKDPSSLEMVADIAVDCGNRVTREIEVVKSFGTGTAVNVDFDCMSSQS